ncbi:MAG: hypothetical protein CV089_17070 [Nitrospira sp. WS110]|nr:hypothetical protein [Nitrospira sp. WS110]
MNSSPTSQRVLLFHNDPTSTLTMTSVLEKAGFQVVEGNLPDLALHELVHDPPCLILAAE